MLSYVRYQFDPLDMGPYHIHDVLVRHWFSFLQQKRPEFVNMPQGVVWILLNIILKSAIMTLCEKGKPEERHKVFPPNFTNKLQELVLLLFCAEGDIHNMDVLTMVPVFVVDLLGLIDRGTVFELVKFFILFFNNNIKIFFFSFL